MKRSKCSNAEMASSAVSPASFDSLPDELALKILKMAALNKILTVNDQCFGSLNTMARTMSEYGPP